MRESRTYGSVRGALSNERPYREHLLAAVSRPTEGDGKWLGGRRAQPRSSIGA